MHHQEKDKQPPFQDERQGISADEKLEGGRDEWSLQNLAAQGSQIDEDEIQRQALRGDETKGDADNRDVAGRADDNETPQGREEAKNDVAGKANANG